MNSHKQVKFNHNKINIGYLENLYETPDKQNTTERSRSFLLETKANRLATADMNLHKLVKFNHNKINIEYNENLYENPDKQNTTDTSWSLLEKTPLRTEANRLTTEELWRLENIDMRQVKSDTLEDSESSASESPRLHII